MFPLRMRFKCRSIYLFWRRHMKPIAATVFAAHPP
jgi:hypothetical protein